MQRYICIHGHFYQPPRENPWLEAVERQGSAYPFHDWNERISAECYAPNSASRIMDEKGRIAKVVNNYSRISFNFGPTLLSWLKENDSDTYRAIQQADYESQKRFSGHGSALAQAYNHMILPLANRRDKHTQIVWGIRDFQERFNRAPEGMWLPETAVDLETLDIMADLGLNFTILAPSQARRVRGVHESEWCDVTGGRIDPSRAYSVHLPSGRRIAVFFYDGPISAAVAFESLLSRGENLFNRLIGAFNNLRNWPQLIHIATDGETYGHHQRHGDMALAHALNIIESDDSIELTNYGEYLERHPPSEVVEIFENTGWSCAHGVGRWHKDCGCRMGTSSNWNQAWRTPLRDAFDWLRDTLVQYYQQQAGQVFRNPWTAREDYIAVILDRSPEKIGQFFSQQTRYSLNNREKVQALNLLELQRHAMLMYTSCGWFFDDVSGIETVQVIQYAARALQLAKETLGRDLEPEFLERLKMAKSNISEHGDGRRIYEKFVKPSMVGLEEVGAHYAISSLFETYPAVAKVYSYTIDRETPHVLLAGKTKLIVGRAKVTSDITWSSGFLCFGVLHLGGHNVNCGIRIAGDDKGHRRFLDQSTQAFNHADYAEVIRLMDRHYGESSCSLRSLFRDNQLKIVGMIVDSTLSDAENAYRQVYENNASLAHVLSDLGIQLPEALRGVAEVVLNKQLRQAVEFETLDLTLVRALLDEFKAWQVKLDAEGLGFSLEKTIERFAGMFLAEPEDLSLLRRFEEVVGMARTLPLKIDFWRTQNAFFAVLRSFQPRMMARAAHGDGSAKAWLDHFSSLGENLNVNIEELKNMMKETASTSSVTALVQEIPTKHRIPRATYRLQLNETFKFNDARVLIPYFNDLGISDLYVSPIMQACPGSRHGYDIVDHNKINPELGGENDLELLSGELSKDGMGLIVDIVPNHMGISDAGNAWWMDVLENGISSLYAPFFDIDWDPAKPELKDKILLPILEDQYGKVLENGKLKLAFEDGSFYVYYYQTKLPVTPCTYAGILSHRLDSLSAALGSDNENLQELQSIITALSYLPPQTERDPEKIAERNREKEVIKRRIAAVYETNREVREAIDYTVRDFNGVVGDPRSFDSLDSLLSMQVYRPAFWKVAAEEINYRRFFDINNLAAIRMEDPQVFEAAHELLFELMAKGMITGLRIDHADGLWDPAQYLGQIQYAYLQKILESRLPPDTAADDVKNALSERFKAQFEADSNIAILLPFYVIVEKILSEGEALPQGWATYGTTGYDFLSLSNGLFVDSSHQETFSKIYSDFIGRQIGFKALVNSTKKMIMLVSLASEIQSLSHELDRISERNRRYRDFTLDTLSFAIREVIASLGVYRTYITGPNAVLQRDRAYIEAAVLDAKKRNPRTAQTLFDFVRDTLLLRNLQDFPKSEREGLIHWVMKFQQITGPVMAKGMEDTAFYVFNQLASVNEVGGDPSRFGNSCATFHRHNTEQFRRWPHSMLASSTHDTKRSEDIRARINVLSEIPDEWEQRLKKWGELNASSKTMVEGESAPDPNDEYLFYQTLLGVWPGRGENDISAETKANLRDRVAAYMDKAIKEAKVHTSWINPNKDYDEAVRDFVFNILGRDKEDEFLNDFLAFQKRIAYFGEFNSISQLLLKLTCPGVPDIYQGSELWDFRLVDPDNREPVDFESRSLLLEDLKKRIQSEETSGKESSLKELALELLKTSRDSRLKLFVIYRTLGLRRDRPDLFSEGVYMPLEAKGVKEEHCVGFTREFGTRKAVVAVPRLVAGLTNRVARAPMGDEVWQNTWLQLPNSKPGDCYRNVFTNEILTVAKYEDLTGLSLAVVFGHFPVALLEGMEPS
jgi:(1->4)-alpha-D-glucan 1-alpha-D-glucosylmutase